MTVFIKGSMKSLFTQLTLAAAISAFSASAASSAMAQEATAPSSSETINAPVKINNGQQSLSFIGGRVLDVKNEIVSVCPPRRPNDIACMGVIQQATILIRFQLPGCISSLGPVTHQTIHNQVGEIQSITVAAVGILDKDSIVARCVAAPSAFKEIKVLGAHLTTDQAQSLVHFAGVESDVVLD